MRYRLYVQNTISKEPRPPLDIQADGEDAARTQAAEMGMEVLRVEPAQQASAATPAAQADVLTSTAGDQAAPSPSRTWPAAWWVLACLVLALASLAGGVAIGMVLPRISPIGPSATSAPTSAAPGSKAIHVEELKSAEDLFAVAGQKAAVFKYSGGDVDFWVEIESQGKKQEIGKGVLSGLLSVAKPVAPGQAVEGYFIWVRGDADDAGRETWMVAQRRELFRAQSFGVQVSSLVGQATATRSKEDRESVGGRSSQQVHIWNGKGEQGIRWTGAWFTLEKGLVPSALPTEHEVRIKEIREGPANDIRLSVSTRAGTVGLFVSPQVGPFLVAATIANVRMDEIMDVHTIRIMCKAAPQTGQPGNGELPAKL